ncbi:hypothetical protein A9Z42_0030480 [Trichoderma parareesei]|uniref:Uncharacterized protein n=1 Tax=Trichoderma parareesei TaxID=858221 RepID=A0A2H2ZTL7_TRIPA|nr:hypothetical protein A9Z42_0030480 [Trichoderma parareesei]
MSTIFKMSRRRAHSVQPLTKETADPTAATAAASAFMRGHSTAQPSLSSAAAAAALRAQPSPPTNVAEVPSKRVQRRASSLSSPAVRDRGKGKPQRSPSVGSMSERTFRSPSPGGRTPLGRQDVPPVPSIPATRTAASPLRTQNFQTASQKSAAHQQQGAWFGPATQHAYQDRRTESARNVTPELPESRSGSVNSSINFSYPRPRMTSSDSQTTVEPDLVYDPNSRRMVPRASLVQASLQVDETAATTAEKAKAPKPVKQRNMPQEPTVEARPKIPDDLQPEPSSTHTDQRHTPDVPIGRISPTASSSFNIPTPAPVTETLPQEEASETESFSKWHNQNASHDEPQKPLTESNLKSGSLKWSNAKAEPPFSYAGSGSSEASVRSAHFAASTDRLVVKHEPPPRSLSPRKSALKSAVSVKGAHHENSELSVTGTSQAHKEDLTPAHRKGARVSWNDNGTVVVAEPGTAEEVSSAAGHNLQPRHNLQSAFEGLKGNKAFLLQQDELMSPRPALPLFGSIRDKKGKEPEERQLVRPRERSLSPQLQQPSTSHSVSFVTNNDVPTPVEVKPMHHSRGQASRNVANISKFREPLPAIVASTESLGQESEELLSSDDELFEDVPTGTEQARVKKPSKALSSDAKPLPDSSPSEASKVLSKTVNGSLLGSPVSNPNPPATDGEVAPVAESSPLPGSFPLDDEVSGVVMDSTSKSLTPGISQSSGHDAETQNRAANDSQGSDESDMDSIYSDAYEDLSEVGEDGFMSLDAALVSSPVASAGGNKTSFSSSQDTKALDGVVSGSFQSSDDWERTKAYWKSLTSEERRRLELEALMEGDDDAVRERSPAKESKSLGDISEYPLTSAQRSQIRHLQREHLAGADPASLGETKQASVASQARPTGLTGSRSSIAADGRQSQAKKGTTELKKGGQPLKQTDFAVTDAQRDYGSVQQSTTAARSGMAMGRRLQKLAQPKRSVSIDQRHFDDESRSPVTRPKSVADLRQRRQEEHPTRGPIIEPATTMIARSTLRRRGSDSSESSFVRSRSVGSPRQGFRTSMRSNSFESKSSLPGPAGRKRLTLRSLSPTTSHTKRSSVTSAAPSRSLFESQNHRSARHSSVEPYTSRFSLRKDEHRTYGDHLSDSSDDDFLNTTPLTDGSLIGDEHEPAHSRLRHSIFHKYTRNSPPDLGSSANAGFTSRHDAERLRGDGFQDDGNAQLAPDQLSGQGSKAAAASASSRRQGLISTLRRRKTDDAAGGHKVILQHHEQDTGAAGWPLQNTNGEAREASMTSPAGDSGRRSAANGADDLTSEPRQPHQLPHYGGSSDANHANPSLQEPKRKKFNSLRKMFKINN